MPRRRSRFSVPAILLLPAVLLLAVTVALRAADITLGQGAIFYRWSQLETLRLLTVLALLPGVALAAFGVFRLARPAERHRAATLMVILGAVWCAAWTWASHPRPVMHHLINLTSPSQDGAFVNEAAFAQTWGAYLKTFPSRMALSVEAVGNSRILSNPPGATLVAISLAPTPTPEWVLQTVFADLGQGRFQRFELAFKYSLLLAAVWLLATVPIWLAARHVLPAHSAAAAAIVSVVSTATIAFTPGKDPAQLLFVGLQLWGAALAVRGVGGFDRFSGAAILGAASVAGAGFGLVLLWTGLAAGIWALWLSHRQLVPWRAPGVVALGALAGALIALLAFQFLLGWNLVETTRLVVRNYPEVQKTIRIDLAAYYLIGLPIWLLFAPAAAISALLLRRRGRDLRRRTAPGLSLLLITAGVMLVTYFTGVPYELPRLWIAFLPLLVVGAFASARPLHLRGPVAGKLVAALLAIHLLASAAQYAFLDVRESEYRLRDHRGYD